MDAWREGQQVVVALDLPGVDPRAVDLDVQRDVLTVRAEQQDPTGADTDLIAAERPRGVFIRQLILADTLETSQVKASHEAGVLTLRIPVAERPSRTRLKSTPRERNARRSMPRAGYRIRVGQSVGTDPS
jgi:HSP20 family protein